LDALIALTVAMLGFAWTAGLASKARAPTTAPMSLDGRFMENSLGCVPSFVDAAPGG
jgi:hypothetical protein